MENSASPFEIVTPSKPKGGSKKGIFIALVVVLFLALGVFAGVLLVRQRQEIREKAARDSCPAAEACPVPAQKSLLRNCTPPEADGSPEESLCNKKGRIQSCGGKEFCCPAVGKAWTTDMTACNASPSPSSSATASASASASATATSTSKATTTATATSKASATAAATASPTKAPIPETGTGWPTIMGISLGVVVILGSFLLAF